MSDPSAVTSVHGPRPYLKVYYAGAIEADRGEAHRFEFMCEGRVWTYDIMDTESDQHILTQDERMEEIRASIEKDLNGCLDKSKHHPMKNDVRYANASMNPPPPRPAHQPEEGK